MIDGGKLPHYLWPWIILAAAYIMNVTPKKKLGWKTPFQIVTKAFPYLGHLRVYGCKAYALNKHIPKLEKLRPRAHVGFLVGYDSTNIYLIWIPSRRKVIRTRDVTFDEIAFYHPGEIDQAQLLTEPFLYDTLDIPPMDYSIIELSSESDEDNAVQTVPDNPRRSFPPQTSGEKGKGKENQLLPSPPTSGGRTPLQNNDGDDGDSGDDFFYDPTDEGTPLTKAVGRLGVLA